MAVKMRQVGLTQTRTNMSKSTQQLRNNQIIETITNFNDGMTSDLRSSFGFAQSKQFYHTRDKLQLREGVTRETGISLAALEDFSNDIFALGAISDAGDVYKKTSYQGGSFASIGTINYESTSWLFGFKNYLFYYDGANLNYFGDVDSSPTQTIGYDTFTSGRGTRDYPKPFVHPTDGYAYFFDRNGVYQLTDAPSNAASASDANWTEAAITIPSYLSIQAACAYGEYIAIFAFDNSKDTTTMFLWDRSMVLEDFTDIKEWGSGEVIYAGTLQGRLFAVGKSVIGTEAYHNTMDIAYYTGSAFVRINSSILTQDNLLFGNGTIVGDPFIDGDKMYFTGIKLVQGSETAPGDAGYFGTENIFALDAEGNITVPYHDSITEDRIKSFILQGEMIMYSTDSGFVYRTTSAEAEVDKFTNTGIYITPVFDGNNGFENKQISVVNAWHSPILTGGSVKIEAYSVELAAWTTLNTNSTVGTTRTNFNRMVTSGNDLPASQEFYYRITITKTKYVYGFRAESTIINDSIS